jgi:hypothetical protein
MDIDYALAWQFIDDRDGRPLQLRFRIDDTGDGDDNVGQLIAVVADGHRHDNHDVVPISRPRVTQSDVDAALDDWQTWARITDETINLAEIRRRIHAAGLD